MPRRRGTTTPPAFGKYIEIIFGARSEIAGVRPRPPPSLPGGAAPNICCCRRG